MVLLGFVAAFFVLRDGGEDEDLASPRSPPRHADPHGDPRTSARGGTSRRDDLIAERGLLASFGYEEGRLLLLGGRRRRGGFWSITGYSCEGDFVRFPDPRRPVLVIT